MSQSERIWVLCKVCGQPVECTEEETPNLAWLRYAHCGGWHLEEYKNGMTRLEALDKLLAAGGLPEGED